MIIELGLHDMASLITFMLMEFSDNNQRLNVKCFKTMRLNNDIIHLL